MNLSGAATQRSVWFFVGCLALAGTACGDDDGSSSDVRADMVVDAAGGDAGDGGTPTPYEQLGGNAGISGAVDLVLQAELADPVIASYFVYNGGPMGTPAPQPGHPSLGQVRRCFINFFGNLAGGPESYPGTTADGEGWQCRDMQASHTEFHVSNAVFDRFKVNAVTALMNAVPPMQLALLGAVLEANRMPIVDPANADAGLVSFDAGDAGGG